MESTHNIARYAQAAWVAPALLIVCGGATVFAWLQTRATIEESFLRDFNQEVLVLEDAIEDRFNVYVTALLAGRALFDASEFVSREEWREFSESLDLGASFPGVQGYGYAEWLDTNSVATYVERVREEGFPDFDVSPSGEREHYASIVYIEPFDERNQQAFGYDMFSETTRRTAMELARDTGDPRMTGRVTLVQEIDSDVQAGFLIYAPTFVHDAPASTIMERREALTGFVYAAFRARNFMEGIVGNRDVLADFMIFAGADTDPDIDALMYTSGIEIADIAGTDPDLVIQKTVGFVGYPWTLYFIPRKEIDYMPSWLVLLSGLVVTALLLIVVNNLARSHQKATLLAEGMVADLEAKRNENETIQTNLASANKELQAQTETLQQKLKELERLNKVMVNRELKMVEMKKQMREQT